VNGKVKRFHSDGTLVSATEGQMEPSAFCVDSGGNIWVVETIVGSRIARFDGRGRLLWERVLQRGAPWDKRSEVLPQSALLEAQKTLSMELMPALGRVTPGPAGTVLVEMDGWQKDGGKPRSVGLLLDPEGKLTRVVPAFGIWSNGYWWSCESSMAENQPPPTVTLKAFAPEGSLMKQIPLDTRAGDGEHYRGVRTGVAGVLPNGDGGCYVVAYAKRASALRVSQKLSILTDYVINRYDSEGRFVREVRLPTSPFMGSLNSLTVGPKGTLYYLRCTATGFEVRALDVE